jgi:hypothetical protein
MKRGKQASRKAAAHKIGLFEVPLTKLVELRLQLDQRH